MKAAEGVFTSLVVLRIDIGEEEAMKVASGEDALAQLKPLNLPHTFHPIIFSTLSLLF